jgi:restriction system protein
LCPEEKNNFSYVHSYLIDTIENKAKLAQQKIQKYNEYSEKFTGLEFEYYCEKQLITNGWSVSRTKITGDQGIDLIIKRNNRSIGVQCKKYSKPVNNKSVQEVVAGMKFYNLEEGIVVSNNIYTNSAKALAFSNNIKLLHYLELQNI